MVKDSILNMDLRVSQTLRKKLNGLTLFQRILMKGTTCFSLNVVFAKNIGPSDATHRIQVEIARAYCIAQEALKVKA